MHYSKNVKSAIFLAFTTNFLAVIFIKADIENLKQQVAPKEENNQFVSKQGFLIKLLSKTDLNKAYEKLIIGNLFIYDKKLFVEIKIEIKRIQSNSKSTEAIDQMKTAGKNLWSDARNFFGAKKVTSLAKSTLDYSSESEPDKPKMIAKQFMDQKNQ